VLLYQGGDNVDPKSQTKIGSILYQEFLGIRGNNVHLTGNITVPTQFNSTAQRNSKFGVEATNISVYEGVAISSGFTFLHANNTVEMMNGSSIKSNLPHSCNMLTTAPDLFSCLSPDA
jgi:hypothetical protein